MRLTDRFPDLFGHREVSRCNDNARFLSELVRPSAAAEDPKHVGDYIVNSTEPDRRAWLAMVANAVETAPAG